MARRPSRPGRKPPGGSAGRYELPIPSRRLPGVLLIVALVLLAVHLVNAIVHVHWRESIPHPDVSAWPWLLRQLFDVDQENNIPTWFSSFLLLTASFFLWLCARKKRAEGAGWSGHWYALALGFLLLAADEVAGVHESINSMIEVAWAVPGGIIGTLVCLAFVPFVLHLPVRTSFLFITAGALYIVGGAGVEMIGTAIAIDESMLNTLRYNVMTFLEEGCEMLAVILFLYALLAYMRGPADEMVVSARIT